MWDPQANINVISATYTPATATPSFGVFGELVAGAQSLGLCLEPDFPWVGEDSCCHHWTLLTGCHWVCGLPCDRRDAEGISLPFGQFPQSLSGNAHQVWRGNRHKAGNRTHDACPHWYVCETSDPLTICCQDNWEKDCALKSDALSFHQEIVVAPIVWEFL